MARRTTCSIRSSPRYIGLEGLNLRNREPPRGLVPSIGTCSSPGREAGARSRRGTPGEHALLMVPPRAMRVGWLPSWLLHGWLLLFAPVAGQDSQVAPAAGTFIRRAGRGEPAAERRQLQKDENILGDYVRSVLRTSAS